MSDTTLVLGGFVFRDMEIPSELTLGGEQSIKIHKLVGGQRIINAMGSDEGEIIWSGLMLGPDALDRALALDSMRAAGLPVIFSVFSVLYNVVVSKFVFVPERYYQVKFTINLTVVQNLTLQLNTSSLLSFTDSILADLASLNGLAGLLNIPSLTSAVGSLNSAVSAVPNFDSASINQLNSVSTQISSTQSVVTSQLGILKSTLF